MEEASKTLCEDLLLLAELIHKEKRLYHHSVLITGATGLIGSLLAKAIMLANQRYRCDIDLILATHSHEKADRIFSNYKNYGSATVLSGDIVKLELDGRPVDYIIHCASITSSKEMISHPVEVIQTTVSGTMRILEIARHAKCTGMVYLSSMEIYGQIESESKVDETTYGLVNPLTSRSSYPESKRLAECLCHAYAKEYQVPVKIARLAQTFGPGISPDDNRVFAQFAKSVINKQNIVLHTPGNSMGNYCYTTDCIRGIIKILLDGVSGEAYNVVNENCTMSIRQVAELVAKEAAKGEVSVSVQLKEGTGYAPDTKLHLSGGKLFKLDWKPNISLKETYIRLIEYLKEIKDRGSYAGD